MHFSLLMNSIIQSWQQDRHATLNHCLVVPQLELYLKHEIGFGEVGGTSCATRRLQSNDFEVIQVYSRLEIIGQCIKALQDAVGACCAGRRNGKDIALGQQPAPTD